jgi:hypothetical protein
MNTSVPDELVAYKAYLVKMFRERADYWEQRASSHRDDAAAVATALAYRGAFNDAATLVEFGEVAW